MTLAELYKQIKSVGNLFNTWGIPMKKDGRDFEILLSDEKGEDGKWFIKVTEE